MNLLRRLRETLGGAAAPASPAARRIAIRGFTVFVDNTRPDIETRAVLERLDESLALIEQTQPWRLAHMRQRRVAVSRHPVSVSRRLLPAHARMHDRADVSRAARHLAGAGRGVDSSRGRARARARDGRPSRIEGSRPRRTHLPSGRARIRVVAGVGVSARRSSSARG